ncbi:MAG: acetate kinase [Planctomycetota bacterium]
MLVLVVNCGSSSIKYQLFSMDHEKVLAKGMAEKLGADDARLIHRHNDEKTVFEQPIPGHAKGLKLILDKLTDKEVGVIDDIHDICAVGHRVVHGGEKFVDSCLIDNEVIRGIEACQELAPLHNPPNLTGIRASMEILPEVPQVAVFDTAFHQTMPKAHYLYAIPYDFYTRLGVRRYGFHGTSHRYVSQRAAEFLGKPFDRTNVITCHLGNGCSMAAVKQGKVIDTSMGLTPLEGLVMGTRSGDIDPAIVFYLSRREGLSADDIDTILNKRSGLLGVSGISNDSREIEDAAAEGNERAALAEQMAAYRVRKYLGAYYAAMGTLDAVVMTGGIGENSDATRRLVLEGLDELGIVLDQQKNVNLNRSAREYDIAADNSRIRLLVIATDEELVIARDTRRLTEHMS